MLCIDNYLLYMVFRVNPAKLFEREIMKMDYNVLKRDDDK